MGGQRHSGLISAGGSDASARPWLVAVAVEIDHLRRRRPAHRGRDRHRVALIGGNQHRVVAGLDVERAADVHLP